MRNEQQLLLISALQGALTFCGWTIEMCIFHLQITAYQRGKWSQTFLDMMAKVTTVLLAAVYVHYVIWSVILSSYSAHEDNMRRCDYGIDKIPTILKSIVVLQCVLFSVFGCVPLFQIAVIVLLPTRSTGFIWDAAAVAYSLLSVGSKGLLALMFVKLLTDGNCINTVDGSACLY